MVDCYSLLIAICPNVSSLLWQVKLPLHEKKETDEVVVFAVENEDDIDDESKWKPVQRRTRVQNGSIVFNVEHFSM